MNDLVQVQVVHTVSDLLRPVEHLRRLEELFVLQTTQVRVQLTVRTVLHDDARELLVVERNAFQFHQIRMIESHEMLHVRFLFRSHFFDGHLFRELFSKQKIIKFYTSFFFFLIN